mmetsp:Transcript_5642/g.8729  ORF Transcript_5642/g.8729 Transcript_5642/m.8729 type:complete len:466 (+) Transcript_5642:74-1471(+)
MLRFAIFSVLVALSFGACTTGPYDATKDYFPEKASMPLYSTNWKIEYFMNYKILTVFHGEQQKDETKHVLVQCGTPDPAASVLEGAERITIPVSTSASMESTFLGFLDYSGGASGLRGIQGTDYVAYKKFADLISGSNSPIVELYNTSDYTTNFALLRELNTDAIFAGNYDYANLKSNGFSRVFYINELEESHPLGRAEWMLAMATLFNAEKTVQQTFNDLVSRYKEAVTVVSSVAYRPTVLHGKPYDDGLYYAPGGRSYMAQYFKDAGAAYAFAADTSVGTFPIPFEQFLAIGKTADIWAAVDNTNWKSLEDAQKADGGRYADFRSVQCLRAYSRTFNVNGFFDIGTVSPDKILWDLIKIFHPTFSTRSFVFYNQLISDTQDLPSFCTLPSDQPKSSPPVLSVGAIVGIAVGGAVFIALVVALIAYKLGYRRGYYSVPSSPAPHSAAASNGFFKTGQTITTSLV